MERHTKRVSHGTRKRRAAKGPGAREPGARLHSNAGRADSFGPLMAWELADDEERLRLRTLNAISKRRLLVEIELYGDIFLRHG